MKTIQHPALPYYSLALDPDGRTYRDNEGAAYSTARDFISRYFPPIDEAAALEVAAARTGRLEMDIAESWRVARQRAQERGAKIRDYAASAVSGSPPANPPATMADRGLSSAVHAAIESISQHFDIYGTQDVVYDPIYRIVGSVDVTARNLATGALTLISWDSGVGAEMDTLPRAPNPLTPFESLPNTPEAKTQAELSVCAWMLTEKGYSAYSTAGDAVELASARIPLAGNEPEWTALEYLGLHARTIMEARFKDDVLPAEIEESRIDRKGNKT